MTHLLAVALLFSLILSPTSAPTAPVSSDQPATEIQLALNQALDHLNSQTADQLEQFRTAQPEYIFHCASTENQAVLACSMGPYHNVVVAHALFWQEDGAWQGQTYPQASGELAEIRQTYFDSLGENCPIGCGSQFRALRQEGDLLLAVVDLSGTGTLRTEEPQLLQRTETGWELIWAPTPGETLYQGNPQVVLPEQGIVRIETRFDDGNVMTWVLNDTRYTH